MLAVIFPKSASCMSARANAATPPRLSKPLSLISLTHTSEERLILFPELFLTPITIPFTCPSVGRPLILNFAFGLSGFCIVDS